MKRSLVLSVILFAVCVCGMIYVSSTVDAQRDQVAITENRIYGEPSAAEGLDVYLDSICSRRLVWNTVYEPGREPDTETEFTFYQNEYQEERPADTRYSGIYVSSTGGIGIRSDNGIALDLNDDESLLEGIGMDSTLMSFRAVLADVAKRTGNDDVHTEAVLLRDYYEYYPLNFDFDIPSYLLCSTDQDLNKYESGWVRGLRKMQEFFRIPIIGEDKVSVTIEKNNGIICGLDLSVDSPVSFSGSSVLRENGCFFAIEIWSSDGSEADYSNIPGGYGIYFLPFVNEGDEKTADFDSLSCVYPLDAGTRILSMYEAEDDSGIQLVTLEDGVYYISVIDNEIGGLIQKLSIFPGENDWLTSYDKGEFVLFNGERELALFERKGGRLSKVLVCDNGCDVPGCGISKEIKDAAWDGERMAVAVYSVYEEKVLQYPEVYNYRFDSCGTELMVYTAGGLQYCAVFSSSLDIGGADLSYSAACRPLSNKGVRIGFR